MEAHQDCEPTMKAQKQRHNVPGMEHQARAKPVTGQQPLPAWQNALCLAVKAFLSCLAWAMLFIFVMWSIIYCQPYWARSSDDPNNAFLKLRDSVATVKYKLLDKGQVWWSGSEVQALVFWWATAFVCAACVLAKKMLPSSSRDTTPASSPAAGNRAHEQQGWAASVHRMVARAAVYPLPPHKVWLDWCDGLCVGDVALHAVWFSFRVVQIWAWTKYQGRRVPSYDAIGLYWHIPQSVYKLERISIAFAWALYADLALLFFPILQNSFIHKMLGTHFAAFVRWHRWLGHYMLMTLTGHGVFYYLYWMCNPDTNFWDELLDWNGTTSIDGGGSKNYLAGTLALMFGFIIWVSSINYVRRNFFKWFYGLHIFGFIGFLVFAQVHYYWNWTCMTPGLVFYGLDIVYRTLQAQHLSVVASAAVTAKGTLVRIIIPIDARLARKMRAGKDVFLQFPSISRWAWHPFTVAAVHQGSDGVEASMSVIIKKYGPWTQTLIESVKMGVALPVRVTGPFGGTHEVDPASVSHVVMFLGGVGATAALAVLRNMIKDAEERGEAPPQTTLVFAAREMEEFTSLDEQVLLEASRPLKSAWLQLSLHHTGRAQESTKEGKEAQQQGKQHDGGLRLDPQGSSSGSDSGANDIKLPPVAELEHVAPLSSSAPITYAPKLSAFNWVCIRPVEPKYLSAPYVLACLVLAWLGAFFGLAQSLSALQERWRQWTDFSDYGLVGVMFLVCICVQAVGLPTALLVLPTHIYRYLSSPVRRSGKPMEVAEPAFCSPSVMDGTRIGVPGGPVIEVQRGRPPVQAVLEAVAARADASKEVLVIAAGPRPMVHQVCLAAWGMNSRRGADSPYLRVVRETYEL